MSWCRDTPSLEHSFHLHPKSGMACSGAIRRIPTIPHRKFLTRKHPMNERLDRKMQL